MLTAAFPPNYTALVQGSSRGIGLALVARLLQDDRVGRVVACARKPETAGELQALGARYPGRLVICSLDISRPQEIEALAGYLRQERVRPNLVINVAGLLHASDGLAPEKRLEDLDFAQMQRVFAVNALGPALLCRHLLPLMASEGKAVLAALSARVGSIGDNRLGGWYAYRASKAALNQILKTASIEARRRFPNVVVAALHPGTTDTALSAPFQAQVPKDKLFHPDFVAEQLLTVINGLAPADSGGFFAWDGECIPW